MAALLMDEDDARALAKTKINSREYWVFIPCGDTNDAICQIEDKFYSGDANADFELFMTPNRHLLGFYLAHKRRMTARQLTDFGNKNFATKMKLSEAVLKEQDIVFMSDEPLAAMNASMALFEWLMGKPIRAQDVGLGLAG